MNGGKQSILDAGNHQAEHPKWITPALIDDAQDVLRASNRPGSDQAAIDLLIALGRLLDAAGILKGEKA